MSIDSLSLDTDPCYDALYQPTDAARRVTSAIDAGFETIGRTPVEPKPLNATPITDQRLSQLVVLEGWERPGFGIGGINGIATLVNQAAEYGRYLQQLTGGSRVEWVYNCTHGKIIDIAEVLLLNYPGKSPNTAALLRMNWTKFHMDNLDHPGAKYLQLCHSQGAIDVRNALQGAPQEIRDRVIVVAIAPGAIVSSALCYKSFNYASERDLVPKGELLFAILQDFSHPIGARLRRVIELHKQLVILPAHPEARGIDHDFLSPTFTSVIEGHVAIYLRGLSAEAPFEDGFGADGWVGLVAGDDGRGDSLS